MNTDFLVLGNCYIKHFLLKSGRTCEICESPHKNRNVNMCNECKIVRKCTNHENLFKKFILGLTDINLTLKEIQLNYKYAGGDQGAHNNYFKLKYQEEQRPIYKNKCICNQLITKNYYITNGIDFLVLGICCFRHLIFKTYKTCEICEQPHTNKFVNMCNECKIINRCNKCKTPCDNIYINGCDKCNLGCCIKCDIKCNPQYRLCYKCNHSGQCNKCGNPCNLSYAICYNCYNKDN